MKNLSGYMCHGIFKGFAEKQSRPNQQGIARTKLECAVEVVTQTDFGESTEMRVFNVPDSIVQMGIPSRMTSLVNKQVALPFVLREWEMNGRKGTSISLCPSVKHLLDADLFTIKPLDAKSA